MTSPVAHSDSAVTGSPVTGGGTKRAALGLLFLSDGLAGTSQPD